jgi:hypothetical protein
MPLWYLIILRWFQFLTFNAKFCIFVHLSQVMKVLLSRYNCAWTNKFSHGVLHRVLEACIQWALVLTFLQCRHIQCDSIDNLRRKYTHFCFYCIFAVSPWNHLKFLQRLKFNLLQYSSCENVNLFHAETTKLQRKIKCKFL